MTGAEHRNEAERLLHFDSVEQRQHDFDPDYLVALAQARATLSIAVTLAGLAAQVTRIGDLLEHLDSKIDPSR